MKKWILALGAPLALSAQPVIAQDDQGEAEMLAAMAEMFKVEPLTAEQEARLPLAREIITTIMPEGAMSEMTGGMFDKMLKPMLEMATSDTQGTLATGLGVDGVAREMNEEEVREATLLIDPVRDERNARITQMMPELMSDMMGSMEPIMRKAMIEIYAANFTTRELTDINTFFKTESGASYARKSLALQQDPRLIAAVMESLPVIMQATKDMAEEMETRLADLPKERVWADLSPVERARLQQLTGLDARTLEEGLANAEEQRKQSRNSVGGF